MDAWMLLAIAVAVLIVLIGVLAVFRTRRSGHAGSALDGLPALGATLVVLGIIFGEDRLLGYGFMLAGVLVSLVPAVLRLR